MMQIMYVVMSVVFIAVGALYYGIHDGHIEAGNLYTPLRIMWVAENWLLETWKHE